MMPDSNNQTQPACQCCQTPFVGTYCHNCGEKLLDKHQRKINVLLTHFVESFYNFDGKIFRSFWSFFFKPGELSYKHYLGIRVPYVKPIAFFFIVNILYFFISPMTDFALPLKTQLMQMYQDSITPMINQHLQSTGLSFDELANQYDTVNLTLAKSLVILSIPFLVPFVYIVNINRKYQLIDHAVFSIYIYAFVLFWPIILSYLMMAISWTMTNLGIQFPRSLWYLLLPYFVYIAIAQKHMYKNSWLVSCAKGFVIFSGMVISHFIYRYIQFWLVWWQIT